METPHLNKTSINVEDDLTASRDVDGIKSLIQMYQTSIRIMNTEINSYKNDLEKLESEYADNKAKLEIFKEPPYLVASVVDKVVNQKTGEIGIIIKTSNRQSVFVSVSGLIDITKLQPDDLIGVNRDSFIPLAVLPPEFDVKAKSALVVHDGNEDFKNEDVGGVSKQMEELREAIVLPLTERERFTKLGVEPGKGVLLFGPPGTGKTLLARIIAKSIGARFMKVSAPELAKTYVGSGAAFVRELFKLARDQAPTIIFIDEIDAIGSKRQSGESSGSQEITRTLLEILNQIDGFSKDEDVKIIAATNRADILDPALMRSGRLDRKIEFGLPDAKGREDILRIHSRGLRLEHETVRLEEVAHICPGFNGAQLRAVCVEAGMAALRKGHKVISHNDFLEGVNEVKESKMKSYPYFV